jgi:hypothetical protein
VKGASLPFFLYPVEQLLIRQHWTQKNESLAGINRLGEQDLDFEF